MAYAVRAALVCNWSMSSVAYVVRAGTCGPCGAVTRSTPLYQFDCCAITHFQVAVQFNSSAVKFKPRCLGASIVH